MPNRIQARDYCRSGISGSVFGRRSSTSLCFPLVFAMAAKRTLVGIVFVLCLLAATCRGDSDVVGGVPSPDPSSSAAQAPVNDDSAQSPAEQVTTGDETAQVEQAVERHDNENAAEDFEAASTVSGVTTTDGGKDSDRAGHEPDSSRTSFASDASAQEDSDQGGGALFSAHPDEPLQDVHMEQAKSEEDTPVQSAEEHSHGPPHDQGRALSKDSDDEEITQQESTTSTGEQAEENSQVQSAEELSHGPPQGRALLKDSGDEATTLEESITSSGEQPAVDTKVDTTSADAVEKEKTNAGDKTTTEAVQEMDNKPVVVEDMETQESRVDPPAQEKEQGETTVQEEGPPVLVIPQGQLRGERVMVEHKPIHIYRGIPFAVAERWKAPVPMPHPAWDGVRDATQVPAACAQYGAFNEECVKRLKWRGLDLPLSENCLTLNIYTPTTAALSDTGPNRPVMMWIHGGAFVEGVASLYDGEGLAALGDVVVVTVNYRLGVFGFLQLAEGRTANFGLLDQLAALQWVKENIKYFGGDENQVTIFGESAGGASVGWLLLAEETSRGLFKRAILQSGTPNGHWAWRSQERARIDTLRLAKNLACDTSDEAKMEACLREKDTDTLLEAHYKLIDKSAWSTVGIEVLDASPIVDGVTIVDTPLNLLSSKASLPVDEVIVGYTQDEMAFFFTRQAHQVAQASRGFTRQEFEWYVADRIMLYGTDPVIRNATDTQWWFTTQAFQSLQKVVEQEYSDGSETTGDDPKVLRDRFFELWTDAFFACPSVELLQELAKKDGLKVFGYVFTHADGRLPSWAKAAHVVELDYVFGSPVVGRRLSLYDPVSEQYAFNEEEKKLSRLMVDLWSSFAHTG